MKLYSKRRLILTDLPELVELIKDTRKTCGYMSEHQAEDFLRRGRVHGIFSAGTLCAVAFYCAVGDGFCTDSMFSDITEKGAQLRYIRALERYCDCAYMLTDHLLCEQAKPHKEPMYLILSYRHIDSMAAILEGGFSLCALRGGLGNKPYLLLRLKIKAIYGKKYRLCPKSDSKELSRMLDHGYHAVSVMGNKLILIDYMA